MPLVDAEGRYPNTKIELRTRANTAIDNLQVWEHSRMEWAELGKPLERFTKARRLGSEPCPVYNCHGLTFGSRRTQVTDAVLPILQDDGFDEMPEKDVDIGDIVIYSNARGEVSHSGLVVGIDLVEIIIGVKSIVPRIWSKWGKGREWVHPIGECPYLEEEGDNTRYYRLRRWLPA